MKHPRLALAHRARLGILLALAVGTNAGLAGASPTPVPGGANQRAGVSGNLSQTLFNGTYRLRSMSLTEPGPKDNIRPKADERALVLRVVISNGTHRARHGYFNSTLVDANGIVVAGRPLDDGWELEPGAAARSANGFSFPADFVPVRIVLVEAAVTNPRAFRINIRPRDLPAVTAPAPSST